MKTILLTNVLSPYRVPLFSALARSFPGSLEIWLTAGKVANREWLIPSPLRAQLPHRVLPGWTLQKGERRLHLNPTLWPELQRADPTVVITGGLSLPTVIALLYCRTRRKKAILWSGVTSWTEHNLPPGKAALRRCLLGHFDAFIAYGHLAREYLCALGAPREDIVLAYNTVEESFFREQSRIWAGERERLRQEMQLPPVVFLYVGQLIARKGLELLLRSTAYLQKSGEDVGLLLVGKGPQEESLHNLGQRLRLRHLVFPGFVQQAELPKFYSLADIFVLPSLDVWGLVINEAMASGLPVVCSERAGASADLIQPGRNGYVFDPSRPDQLTVLLRNLVRDPQHRRWLGCNAQKTMSRFTVEATTKGFLKAFYRALEKPRGRREKTISRRVTGEAFPLLGEKPVGNRN